MNLTIFNSLEMIVMILMFSSVIHYQNNLSRNSYALISVMYEMIFAHAKLYVSLGDIQSISAWYSGLPKLLRMLEGHQNCLVIYKLFKKLKWFGEAHAAFLIIFVFMLPKHRFAVIIVNSYWPNHSESFFK